MFTSPESTSFCSASKLIFSLGSPFASSYITVSAGSTPSGGTNDGLLSVSSIFELAAASFAAFDLGKNCDADFSGSGVSPSSRSFGRINAPGGAAFTRLGVLSTFGSTNAPGGAAFTERRSGVAAGVVACSGNSFADADSDCPDRLPRGRRVAALRLPREARALVGCPESFGVAVSSESTAPGAVAAPAPGVRGLMPGGIPSGMPKFIPRCLIEPPPPPPPPPPVSAAFCCRSHSMLPGAAGGGPPRLSFNPLPSCETLLSLRLRLADFFACETTPRVSCRQEWGGTCGRATHASCSCDCRAGVTWDRAAGPAS